MSEHNRRPAALRAPLDPRQIHLADGLSYACQYSGRCCEDFWEIPVDDESLARLKSLPLSSLSPKFLDPASYTEPGSGPKGAVGLRRVGGRCVFLDPGRRCLIHRHFGAAAKPQTCHDFPFRYIHTPRGVFVGASMACPSIRGNSGRPLAELRQELAERYANSLSLAVVADPVELSAGLPIGFDAYEEIELCLKDLLAIETLSLDDRLIAGYVLLQILDRAVRELGEPPDRAGENVVRLVNVFRQGNYRRPIAIARKARGSARLHRALIGLLLTYRSAFDERQRGRLGRSAYLLYQYVRHMGGLGTLAMPPIEERLRPARLRAVRCDWSDPFFVHTVGRFCGHSLFRKDAILTTPLLKGYAFLLVFVALIRWYAAAYAVANDVSEVGRDEVEEAVGAVEKYYCFHADFMRLFDQYPVLSGTVERLLAKPFFAPSMIRPKGP